MEMSNKKKAIYLARVIAALLRREGVTDVRIPLKELEDLPSLGFVVEDDVVIVALGE